MYLDQNNFGNISQHNISRAHMSITPDVTICLLDKLFWLTWLDTLPIMVICGWKQQCDDDDMTLGEVKIEKRKYIIIDFKIVDLNLKSEIIKYYMNDLILVVRWYLVASIGLCGHCDTFKLRQLNRGAQNSKDGREWRCDALFQKLWMHYCTWIHRFEFYRAPERRFHIHRQISNRWREMNG